MYGYTIKPGLLIIYDIMTIRLIINDMIFSSVVYKLHIFLCIVV